MNLRAVYLTDILIVYPKLSRHSRHQELQCGEHLLFQAVSYPNETSLTLGRQIFASLCECPVRYGVSCHLAVLLMVYSDVTMGNEYPITGYRYPLI